jgi:hypothetical protein
LDKKVVAPGGLDKSLQRPAQQGQINILLIFSPKSAPELLSTLVLARESRSYLLTLTERFTDKNTPRAANPLQLAQILLFL